MASFLTHVLAGFLIVQVLLGFLLLREFLVSGNRACWLMLELGENVLGKKVLESNQGVFVKSTAESDTTLDINIIVFCLWPSSWSRVRFGWTTCFHRLKLTSGFKSDFILVYLNVLCTYIVWLQNLLWFCQTKNVLWMAANMVLSQMPSSMMISCALALIVMFSLVFETHFGFWLEFHKLFSSLYDRVNSWAAKPNSAVVSYNTINPKSTPGEHYNLPELCWSAWVSCMHTVFLVFFDSLFSIITFNELHWNNLQVEESCQNESTSYCMGCL